MSHPMFVFTAREEKPLFTLGDSDWTLAKGCGQLKDRHDYRRWRQQQPTSGRHVALEMNLSNGKKTQNKHEGEEKPDVPPSHTVANTAHQDSQTAGKVRARLEKKFSSLSLGQNLHFLLFFFALENTTESHGKQKLKSKIRLIDVQ